MSGSDERRGRSPRHEPDPEALRVVRSAAAQQLGEDPGSVGIESVRRLSGGASRLTWSVETDGGTELVVQQERPGSAGSNLAMSVQSELLRRAASAGVPVPHVLGEGGERGRGFVVLSRVEGESVVSRIRSDPALGAAMGDLARQVGRACAHIHSMDTAGLGDLLPAHEPLESMRALLDALGEPHPAFEAGIAHLARNRPPPAPERLVHGDLRMGNLLVGPEGLTAVLDWELAHMSAPGEDLGWFCVRAWRFGSRLRAGGVGTAEQLLAGYAEGGGTPPSPEELDWWEAYGCLRWGLICVLQASVHLSGAHRSAELAAIGRRAAECEEDLLQLVWGESGAEPPPPPQRGARPPHDAPAAPDLLEAVVEELESVRSRLEGSDRFALRVAANALGVVHREMAYGDVLAGRHRERLAALGAADDAELARALREGTRDDRDPEVRRALREMVRDKLAVSNPGYWSGDGDS